MRMKTKNESGQLYKLFEKTPKACRPCRDDIGCINRECAYYDHRKRFVIKIDEDKEE
jgi:hypothetical protein